MKDPKLHAIHVLECVKHIESFMEGIEYEAFQEDLKTYYAVVRVLQTMAESKSILMKI